MRPDFELGHVVRCIPHIAIDIRIARRETYWVSTDKPSGCGVVVAGAIETGFFVPLESVAVGGVALRGDVAEGVQRVPEFAFGSKDFEDSRTVSTAVARGWSGVG